MSWVIFFQYKCNKLGPMSCLKDADWLKCLERPIRKPKNERSLNVYVCSFNTVILNLGLLECNETSLNQFLWASGEMRERILRMIGWKNFFQWKKQIGVNEKWCKKEIFCFKEGFGFLFFAQKYLSSNVFLAKNYKNG